MRSPFRPSPAMIVACIALVVALGGTTYAATGGKFILGQSNTASSKSTLSAPIADKALTVTNNSTKPGAMALGLNVANGHPPFKVNSPTKVANLNADSLDGQDSTAFGQVRQFSHSIAAASAGPPPFDMVTFRGLTLSSEGFLALPDLYCRLEFSTADAGRFDSTYANSPGTSGETGGEATPVDHDIVAVAGRSNDHSVGQIVFHDQDTGRVLTVAFSINTNPYSDVNNANCRWQGTITAAG